MQSFWIVEALNVIVGGAHRMFVCFVIFVVNLLDFEAFEKTLHRRIVVTVSFAAHALQKTTIVKSFPKRVAGELRAAIRVDDQTARWFAQSNGLVEAVDCKLSVNFSAHRPADNTPRTEVLKRTEVAEAFTSGNVGEIGEPHLIDAWGGKLLVQTVRCDRQIVIRISC